MQIWTLTPEAAVCALGEAVLLQSSELVEDVDVGVMGTAVVLLPEKLGIGIKKKYFPDRKEEKKKQKSTTNKKPKQLQIIAATLSFILYLPEHAFDLFMFLGFRFLV